MVCLLPDRASFARGFPELKVGVKAGVGLFPANWQHTFWGLLR
jgi:hypothetical protein